MRKRKNQILRLRRGDRLETDNAGMGEIAAQHFTDLLGTPVEREHSLDLSRLGLSQVDMADLDRPFSEKEIWEVIKGMPADKAPGPDGFSARFYQSCCPTIRDAVMRAVHAFDSADGRGFARLNGAYITLLPKKEDALDIADYRPISLIPSFAKIIPKAMATRLASVLSELVDRNQSAFIKERSIQDNFFLVHQSVKTLHRRKMPSMLLKLDMAKAFDSIAWPFVFEVLRHRGCGPKWLARFALMLSSATSKVLINGVPGPQFSHAKGFRQGDSLSPMKFVVMVDVLNAVFKLAEEAGVFLTHFAVGHKTSAISIC